MTYTYKVVYNALTNVSTCHNKNYKYHANTFIMTFLHGRN